jgi:FMN phosphatase YigB (HAD superfamily)
LISQFVTEAVVLSGVGAALGLGLTRWAIQLLRNLVSQDMMARTPFLRDPSWNGRVMGMACAIALGAAVLLSIPPSLNPEAPALLAAVKKRGLKVGLISNTGRSPGTSLRQLLDNYGVLKFFDATVFSNEVMRRKPDRAIFDHASKLLEAKNEAIVHVGDNPEADFWGARNAGMRAILLDQAAPSSTQWPPNSLFALTRANMRKGLSTIEPRWRIDSLTRTLDLMDSF